MTMVPSSEQSPFDAIRELDSHGGESWSARTLMPLMAYPRWQHFEPVIDRAMAAARNVNDTAAVFTVERKNPGERGGRPLKDYRLSRAAAYYVAMNGDPSKPEVAAAQAYFVRRTREAETQVAPTEEKPKEITAAAGPLPYREQAEILTILRPVLPESYATATGKVIMARAMGDRPELLPAETPLYAATFLAEKGHKAKTVAKFQSGFGARVSNLYFKVHGRRPEKIPGPAGSRIDKVAVYTDEDRPLLEQVYAVMLDAIRAFETGGQAALGEGEAA